MSLVPPPLEPRTSTGSVLGVFWGSRQLSPFGGGGPAGGLYRPPPWKRKPGSPSIPAAPGVAPLLLQPLSSSIRAVAFVLQLLSSWCCCTRAAALCSPPPPRYQSRGYGGAAPSCALCVWRGARGSPWHAHYFVLPCAVTALRGYMSMVGIHALARQPVGGGCRRCLVGLLGGGRPPSEACRVSTRCPALRCAYLPTVYVHGAPFSRFGTAIQEGDTSRCVWLRVVNFVVEAHRRPLWLPRGIGMGPWWTWWARLLSLGGKPLGCRRARHLIHGAEPAHGVGSSVRRRTP